MNSPTRWEQTKNIFQAALERPPEERERFIGKACRGDESLREEIRVLLSSFDSAGSFLEATAITEVAKTIVGKQRKLVAGQNLGRYKIARKIGAGGMGEVFVAKDAELERFVALKILSAEFSGDAERVRRFVQEARAVSALNHPNILTIYEIGQIDELRFIATEFIKGETLRQRQKRASLDLREILEIAWQTAAALTAAHEARIIHRDIKPENIMLREDGFVKVLDFGLAKLIEKKLENSGSEAAMKHQVNTTPGIVMGTVAYMSPEQARGKEADARTDVWSLGVVIYEMLTGRQPFPGETTSDTIAAILKSDFVPLGEETPPELRRIVEKSLQKQLSERYQSVRDVSLDLKNLKKELEFAEEIKRSNAVLAGGSSGGGQASVIGKTTRTQEAQNAMTNPAGTAGVTQNSLSPPQPSNAEYPVGEIRKNGYFLIGIFAALLTALLIGGYLAWRLAAAPAKTIRSVAVLPFVNGSNDANLEYLSDGVSERLIDRLSQLSQLKVISRSSSFKYRGDNLDLKQIADALEVDAIILGRVAARDDSLMVRVELVDCRDRAHQQQLWSDQYVRQAVDLQAVQENIVQTVLGKLQLRLSGIQEQQLARRETVNPAAYEALLKGRFYWNKGGTENRKKAIDYYKHAINLDPNYALAYIELSLGYQSLVGQGTLAPGEFTPQAVTAMRKGLELDENLAEAHLALAEVKRYAWQWSEAEEQYRRTIELNPNLVRGHGTYSRFLSVMGRHDEAAAEYARARELDPLSIGLNANYGQALYFARRYDEAIDVLQKNLEIDAAYPANHVFLGYNYAAKKMNGEAAAAYEKAVELGDDSTSAAIFLGAAYAQGGERERAQAIVEQLENGRDYVSPAELAILYGALNEREKAFALLEKAFAEHDLQLQFLKADPAYDPLRSDPRFGDFLKRLGLPQ